MVLTDGGLPWKEHLSNIEEEEAIEPTIKYVLYEDANNNWRVQCVPKESSGFENR